MRPAPILRSLRTLALLAISGLLGLLPIQTATAQNVLINGTAGSGTFATAGRSDLWTFTASPGAAILVRMGGVGLTPKIRVYAPNNTLLAENTPGNTLNRDGSLITRATTEGTYSIEVSAAYSTQVGSYSLSLALTGSPLVIPGNDQGGDLVNGAATPGEIPVGDLDPWRFEADAGDRLILRMGAQNFTPAIRLFGPDGALVAETTSGNTLARDGFVSALATNPGPYTVVVSTAFADQNGTYTLHLAKTPGSPIVSPSDEGGSLVNGARTPGKLDLGDLDVWHFSANPGDSLDLRVGATSFTPWLRLLGPTGAVVAETTSGNTLARDGEISFRTTDAGRYTLILAATFGGQSGDYHLTLAQSPGAYSVSPGDQGGELINGSRNPGTLELGDFDLWHFAASVGETVVLRAGATNFTPWLRLYGPDGAPVAETTSGNNLARDGFLSLSPTNTGSYTLVLGAAFLGQSGDYNLHFAKAPGTSVISENDDGGSLENGSGKPGTLELGDLDLWHFEANANDQLLVRVGTDSFTPWIRLYGPSGSPIAETTSGNTLARDGFIAVRATNAGPYSVLVSATYGGQSGTYSVALGRAPSPLVVPPGDQGGPLINGLTNLANLTLGDIDIWSFIGTPGDSNTLRVASSGFTPWLRLYGPDGSLIRETTSGNTLARNGTLSLNITNAGTYLLFVSATFAGQSGDYSLKQSRVPPDLILPPPPGVTLDEGLPLEVTLSAQDPDDPNRPLQFNLLSAPPGVTLSNFAATNVLLSWTTTEQTGPSTNLIVATVTDLVNGRSFTRTNEFTVVVHEINSPPVLSLPADTTVDEQSPLVLQATATDPDLPANPLTFSLVDPPQGMTIQADTGTISWQPSEAQGPGTYPISVVVTDSNPHAVNATSLSVTNQFQIVVRELNQPPTLLTPTDVTLDESVPFVAQASATDPDLPANPLAFRLVAAPAGMTLDPLTGAIAWTPSEAQGPSTNLILVAVTDDNPAAANARQLSVTNSFRIVVRELNQPPTLAPIQDQTLDELTAWSLTASASDADLPPNPLTYSLVDPPSGLAIDAATGAMTWTPTETQGPATNEIVLVVTDHNPDAQANTRSSVTNRFRLVVREVNTAPTWSPLSDRTLPELTTLTLESAASDVDLPANRLSYSLASAPAGASISPTGTVQWTPTEAQGPSTNLFVLVVTDDGSPALTATNRFTVVVTEVNLAPRFLPAEPQSLHFGTPLSLTLQAADDDLPANQLTYTLVEGPQDLTIDAQSGTIRWTPAQSQVGNHTAVFRVTDDANPALSDTLNLLISVEGSGSKLEITDITGGLKQIRTTGDLGLNYELQVSSDLVRWEKLVEFRMTATPYLYIDPASLTEPVRFYRLLLRQ